MPALLCGDLDVVLGRLPVQFYDEALEIEQLVGESMSVVSRPGHSLFDLAKVTLVEVVMQTWTLRPLGSPMRKRVEQAMQHVSVAAPPAIVEASLILATTTLLEPRDMISAVPLDVAKLCQARTDGHFAGKTADFRGLAGHQHRQKMSSSAKGFLHALRDSMLERLAAH